jgi:hypothetical protein
MVIYANSLLGDKSTFDARRTPDVGVAVSPSFSYKPPFSAYSPLTLVVYIDCDYIDFDTFD